MTVETRLDRLTKESIAQRDRLAKLEREIRELTVQFRKDITTLRQAVLGINAMDCRLGKC